LGPYDGNGRSSRWFYEHCWTEGGDAKNLIEFLKISNLSTVLVHSIFGPFIYCVDLAHSFKHEEPRVFRGELQLAIYYRSDLACLTDVVREEDHVYFWEAQSLFSVKSSFEGSSSYDATGTVSGTAGPGPSPVGEGESNSSEGTLQVLSVALCEWSKTAPAPSQLEDYANPTEGHRHGRPVFVFGGNAGGVPHVREQREGET
jgi:hypothetical protein